MAAHYILHRIGLDFVITILPICNVKESFSKSLTKAQVREWTILYPLDQYSPEHDHRQRIADVVKVFERCGVKVIFSGFEKFGEGMTASVVRGIKKRIEKERR